MKDIAARLKPLIYPNTPELSHLNQGSISPEYKQLVGKQYSKFEKAVERLAKTQCKDLAHSIRIDKDVLYLSELISELCYSDHALESPEMRKAVRKHLHAPENRLRGEAHMFLARAGDPLDVDSIIAFIYRKEEYSILVMSDLEAFPEEYHDRMIDLLCAVLLTGDSIEQFHALQALNHFNSERARKAIIRARKLSKNRDVLNIIKAIEKTWELGVSSQDDDYPVILSKVLYARSKKNA